jgi:hypothetical protein
MAETTTTESRVQTGSKVQFLINGKKIAYASNVSWNENIAFEPINVLDKLEVAEHAETGYTVDLQCQAFRVINQSVKSLGIMQSLSSILSQGYMTASVVSKDGTVLLLMEGVKLQSRQNSVDARGVMTETWSFVGIKALDEFDNTP